MYLGMGEKLDSALILDVNTLNQKCFILQHPLIKDFIAIIRKINTNSVNKSEIEDFQTKLETLKNTIKS